MGLYRFSLGKRQGKYEKPNSIYSPLFSSILLYSPEGGSGIHLPNAALLGDLLWVIL